MINVQFNCIVTKYDGYSIEKEISLVGVPQEFVDEMNLPLYVSKPNKKLKKK